MKSSREVTLRQQQILSRFLALFLFIRLLAAASFSSKTSKRRRFITHCPSSRTASRLLRKRPLADCKRLTLVYVATKIWHVSSSTVQALLLAKEHRMAGRVFFAEILLAEDGISEECQAKFAPCVEAWQRDNRIEGVEFGARQMWCKGDATSGSTPAVTGPQVRFCSQDQGKPLCMSIEAPRNHCGTSLPVGTALVFTLSESLLTVI